MSELTESKELLLDLFATLVLREGGYVKIEFSEGPTGPYTLMSRIDRENGCIEIKVEQDGATQ